MGLVAIALAVSLSGCHWDMWNNARLKPFEPTPFFEHGQSARGLVEGTVPYLAARTDEHYYTGRVNGEFAKGLPASIELNRALLERGQNRFNIYCIVCHSATGISGGMIVKRGFPAPPSYVDLLRRDPPADQLGYYFDGFGRMYSYATRVTVEDRWAIAAYVRVLQFSQYATPNLLPADVLELAKKNVLEPEPDEEGGEHGETESDDAGESSHGDEEETHE